jgi:hypothetical protein
MIEKEITVPTRRMKTTLAVQIKVEVYVIDAL